MSTAQKAATIASVQLESTSFNTLVASLKEARDKKAVAASQVLYFQKRLAAAIAMQQQATDAETALTAQVNAASIALIQPLL